MYLKKSYFDLDKPETILYNEFKHNKENKKMKRYAVIDRIKDGDMFDEYFATEKEALAQPNTNGVV